MILDSWSPLVFVISLIIIALIMWAIRHKGQRVRKKTPAFFAANPVPPRHKINYMYWGFQTAMGRVYRVLRELHSGLINDYVYWLILLTIIIWVVMLI